MYAVVENNEQLKIEILTFDNQETLEYILDQVFEIRNDNVIRDFCARYTLHYTTHYHSAAKAKVDEINSMIEW